MKGLIFTRSDLEYKSFIAANTKKEVRELFETIYDKKDYVLFIEIPESEL